MNQFLSCLIILLGILPFPLAAQQQVSVISRCGGMAVVNIPSITDNDLDGMDDALEQRLLEHFMPVIIEFSNENCPGPALDGTGDSNLVVCRIYPVPQQYVPTAHLDSVKTHPVQIVPDTGLVTGIFWYEPVVMVQCALIYGKDCGLLGHTADVEGFGFSLKYTGSDSLAGWMHDTTMQHWMGVTIQTVSHANTLCEQIETGAYKSALAPTGFDTIYASPDKHGTYLTISECGASFICNPACTGAQSEKAVKVINLGEADAPLVADLGNYYAAYAGENPWGNSEFLTAQGGSAGKIKDKMLKPLTAAFITGEKINSASEICDLYKNCYPCGNVVYDLCVASGDTIPPGTAGFKPVYDCSGVLNSVNEISAEVLIFPVPASNRLRIIYPDKFTATLYDLHGRKLKQILSNDFSASVDISTLSAGCYLLQITSVSKTIFRKVLIE